MFNNSGMVVPALTKIATAGKLVICNRVMCIERINAIVFILLIWNDKNNVLI